MVYWIAQGFGILGLLVMIISLFQKNKDRIKVFFLNLSKTLK